MVGDHPAPGPGPARDPAAAELERSSERWLAWLTSGTAGRHDRPGAGLLALWDLLEAWFDSDEFAASPVATAMAAPPDSRGPAVHAVLVRHRRATRRLLEDLARSSGAADPPTLADQLLTLVEGAIAGAMIDRHAGAARHARELTQIALAHATPRRPRALGPPTVRPTARPAEPPAPRPTGQPATARS